MKLSSSHDYPLSTQRVSMVLHLYDLYIPLLEMTRSLIPASLSNTKTGKNEIDHLLAWSNTSNFLRLLKQIKYAQSASAPPVVVLH